MKSPKTTPRPVPGELLDRLEYILLLAAVATAVLVYPLRLDNRWLMPLVDGWARDTSGWGAFCRTQFEPFLSFFFSPLMLKGVLAGVFMIAFVAVRFIRWLVAPAPAAGGRWAWVSVPAFFGWVALSSLWSPTPVLAHTAALWALMFGAFLYCLLRRGLTLREIAGLAHLLLAMGAVALAIAYLQSIPLFAAKIFLVMYQFPEMRNRYGTLLGHNTAAASYFMMTAFPCFALLLIARRTRRRVAYGIYLAALLLAILILQSRAVWIFFPILGVLAVRSGLRASLRRAAGGASRLRWLPAILLGMLLLTLATQLVDRPWNPLYIRNNPFGQRLKALSLKSLQGESRLRLNIISATLVPQAPLFGHGLFAYQMIYPRRQAEYFAEHADTWLNQPTARSHMAHDEYMQVLVDQGAVGLGLLLWILGEAAVRGRRRRRELRGMARLLHEGLGWSALGFALHAFVDFPYHLPQLALPGLACLAAWGACRRRPRPDGAPAALRLGGEAPATAFRPMVFARLLAVFTAGLLVPLGAVPLLRCLQGDFYFCRSQAYLECFKSTLEQKRAIRGAIADQLVVALAQAIERDPALGAQVRAVLLPQLGQLRDRLKLTGTEITPEISQSMVQAMQAMNGQLTRAHARPEITLRACQSVIRALGDFRDFSFSDKIATLKQAIGDANHALLLMPNFELVRLNEAEMYGALGLVLLDTARANPDKEAAAAIAKDGRGYLRRGIETLNTALKGIDYHMVYWSRANLYKILAKSEPDRAAADDAGERYRRDVRDAVFFCPASSQFVREMIEVMENDPAHDPVRLTQLRARLWKLDPDLFTALYIAQIMDAFQSQRYALAAGRMELILKIDPGCVRWLNHAALFDFWAGNRPRAVELFKKIYTLDPLSMIRDGSIVPMLCLQQNWSMLLRFLKTVSPAKPVERAEFRALELEALRRLKRTGQAPIFTCPAGLSPEQWNQLVAEAVPSVLLHYFDEPARARAALDERLAMKGLPPAGVRFWIEGCYIAQALKDPALFRRCLEAGLQTDPAAPAFEDLKPELNPPPAPPAGGTSMK